MWFKKQKKLDPKVRFQSPDFTKRLQEAKSYKREAKPLPEKPMGKALLKLGLDSLFSKILVGLGLVGLVYLVYIPNFLTIRTIQIQGANSEVSDQTQKVVKQYLGNFRLFPQWNLLFLKPQELTNYILAHDKEIYNVEKVNKKFFHTLVINVTPKHAAYLLATPESLFTLFNDGSVLKQESFDQGAFTSSSLGKMKQNFNVTLDESDTYVPKEQLGALDLLFNQLPSKTQLGLDYIQIHELGQDRKPNWREISAFVRRSEKSNDFEVKFDTQNISLQTLGKLNLLLGALNPQQQNTIAYIDMRLMDKSYVCFVGTSCDRPTEVTPSLDVTPPTQSGGAIPATTP